MAHRRSILGGFLVLGMLLGVMGCQSGPQGGLSLDPQKKSQELVVYVTQGAHKVREKALSYGLNVKSIESDSTGSQLLQTLINSPTGEYFVVINPVQKRYIDSYAVPEKWNKTALTELDNKLRRLNVVSKAGAEQVARLHPTPGKAAKLLVFSDFECPYCKMADAGTISQLQDQFGDKLDIEMVHFPLEEIHQYAFDAAEASECARVQGKFDVYKKALFEAKDPLNEYVRNFWARRVGLNTKQFMNCMYTHQQRKKVRHDQYFGMYLGVNGTPTYVLNGKVLNSSPEIMFAEIQKVITATAGKGNKPQAAAPPPTTDT